MDNIKAFLEADVLRTQGEWNNNSRIGKTNVQAASGRSTANAGGYTDNLPGGKYHYENEANANFIAAASRIAPDLAKMVDDMRVAKEALEMYAASDNGAYQLLKGFNGRVGDVCPRSPANKALTRLKPYEKLFEKEGER